MAERRRIEGGVLSIFKVTDATAVFPALSTAVPVMTWPAPCVVTLIGDGQEAIPDKVSVHAKVTVTSVLFHPFAFGLGLTVVVMAGGVLSMFNVTAAVAALPALSMAVPVMTWPAPCVVTLMGDGQEAIPDKVSVHAKVTVTSVLFHPFALGLRLTAVVIRGGVLSMFSRIDAEAWFPA